MTDVQFHFGVQDRVTYVCRLARKAVRQGATVLLCGEESEIDLLDKALWTFEPSSFLAHWRLRDGQVVHARFLRTPVWLMGEGGAWPDAVPRPRVLVHLAAGPAEDADAWERVIEAVTSDPEDRQRARQRWRAYERRGWAPKALNVGEGP